MSSSPDLKGSSFTLSVLHLSDNDVHKTIEFLKDRVQQAPSFFASAPVVINIEQVSKDIDFASLKQGILDAGLVPVGITGCKNKQTQKLATEAGFAIMLGSKSPAQAIEAPASSLIPAKVIRTPIRSGQQVYAKDCDLVIMNNVSAGAEVIADGSIHVYGTLRGRALAGANGQKEAIIVCHDLQAELLSIAGSYWLSDQIEREFWQSSVMVSTLDDSLQIEPLTI